jgi:HD-like signal output (HDOD) protein
MTQPENGLKKEAESLVFPPALEKFVSQLSDIQLLSLGAVQLMRELNKEDISGREISSRVSQDPTLSARILQLANSSYYGTTHRISTVNQAVTMLGVENVRHLVKGLCMVEMSTPKGGLAKVFGGKAFAAHAIAVSFLSGCLCKKFGFQLVGRGEAETAGLLHDIGMALLGSGDRNKYQAVQFEFWSRLEDLLSAPEGLTLTSVEEEILGFNHAQLGGWLAKEWNLPLHIREALYYHHGSIEDCVNREMVTVVQVAEFLSNDQDLDYLPRGACGPIHPSVVEFLESQGKAHLLDSLPVRLEAEIQRAHDLYKVILDEGKVSMTELEEKVRMQELPPIPQIKPASPPNTPVPTWAYFVPGLPQFQRGQNLVGAALLVGVLLSLCLFLLTSLSGTSLVLSAAFFLVAAACWLLSAILA